MGAIAWHGVLVGSIPLAVVGALVSLFAKILWLGIMKHIDRDLSQRDQAWVEAETSSANAKLALAGVRRQVARAEARAALELLAAEETRRGFSGWTEAPETVPAYAETDPSDAVASRRRDAISPAGQGADIRLEDDAEQVSGAETEDDVRPDAVALRAPIAFDAETDQDEEPEERPRLSLAGAVRTLVEDHGLTDPKAIAGAAAAMTGREVNRDSVAREIRAARARMATATEAARGPYL
jgi:hypothetical protein